MIALSVEEVTTHTSTKTRWLLKTSTYFFSLLLLRYQMASEVVKMFVLSRYHSLSCMIIIICDHHSWIIAIVIHSLPSSFKIIIQDHHSSSFMIMKMMMMMIIINDNDDDDYHHHFSLVFVISFFHFLKSWSPDQESILNYTLVNYLINCNSFFND